jgi:hypothetical protein
MCDPATIDDKNDLEPCDLVYPDYVVENRQLYRNEGQRWWWCRDQMDDEAWIFLQSDTDASTKPGELFTFLVLHEKGMVVNVVV